MNLTTNLRRIVNETKQLQSLSADYTKMFSIKMIGENMFHWQSTIYGPDNTLYAGYEFDLDIILPEDYPQSPVTIKFVTPIQHMNINSEGDICVDILKNKWTSKSNITSVIISIISLLSDPNPLDPLNSDLAELYRTDKKKYKKSIQNYCERYAYKK